MFRLVYLSTTNTPFSKAELTSLLQVSRSNNQRLGITGMLLYKDDNFIQILEGEKEAVRDLYDQHISRDPRHHNLILLVEEKVSERLFSQWSMGFRDLNDPEVHALPGYSQFMNEAWPQTKVRHDAAGYMELLKLFRRGRIGG